LTQSNSTNWYGVSKISLESRGIRESGARRTYPNGRQKVERGTGRPMWSTQVFVLDDDGGEVITITTAGEKPNVKVGQLVAVSKLEALPWATNGRNGVAFRAEEIKAAPGLSSVKTSRPGCEPLTIAPTASTTSTAATASAMTSCGASPASIRAPVTPWPR
jgi:hypothetical protein